MRRSLSPAILLLPLFAALAVAAWWVPWRSLISCDCRTYLEMIRGVTDHGLPYTSNGPVADFPELRARWNTAVDGRLWGMYGPVYAYVAAPAYALDGVRGVLRLNFGLLALLAVGFYRLLTLVLDDPRRAVVGPYLLLLATPVAGLAHTVSAYTLTPVLLVWSAYFLCNAASRRNAMVAGVLFGLAVSTHVMVGPLILPLLVVVWRHRQQPLLPLLIGLGMGLFPTVALNLLRYGTANPLAAAPCSWKSCTPTGVDRQNLGSLLRFAGAPIGVVAVSAIGFWLLRGRRVLQLVVFAAAAALLLGPVLLRRPTLLIGRLALALIADVGLVDLGHTDFARPADGRGYLLLDFAIKSGLQSSPLLLLGVMARPQRNVARFATMLSGALAVTLVLVLSLRAEMQPAYAIGFPILHLRYLFPILPFGVLLVTFTLDTIERRRIVAAATLVAAVLLIVWLWRGGNDVPPLRRLVILRATLASAALALIGAVLAHRRRAPVTAALLVPPALALSLAMTIGVDVRAWINLRTQYEHTMQSVARQLPQRAALLAHAVVLDPVLGTLHGRDLEYADFYESRDPESIHRLILHWIAEARPVFAVVGNRLESPYTDLRYQILDRATGLVRITSLDEHP